MNKFLTNLLLLFPFLLVVYIVLNFCSGTFLPNWLKPNINYKKGGNGHLYTRLLDIENYNDVDILFVGSSHAYRGFDTRIFKDNNYSSFNLGSSSQTPIQTSVLLDRYINTLNPKIIVYEVYPKTLMSDGVESALDLIANEDSCSEVSEMVFRINNLKLYNTYIYKQLRLLLNLDEKFVEDSIKGNDSYISGGFVEKKMVFNKDFSSFENCEINVKKEQLDAFQKILLHSAENDIKVILVFAPITSSYYKSFSNISMYDSLMSHHSTYYNFNEIIMFNDTIHFFDADHLNQDGVKMFNQKLIEIINLECN